MQLTLTQDQVALIDDVDFEQEHYCEFKCGFVWTGRVRDRKWASQKSRGTFYAFCTVGTDKSPHQLYLHRLPMDAGRGQLIDHIDGDGLNCQRSNLRLATQQANSRNRRQRGDRQYKGVFYHKQSGKFAAAIGINGRSRHLGLFADPVEAARAYDAAAIKVFGAFARLNFAT